MSGFNALHTRAFAGHKKTINSVSWNGAGDRCGADPTPALSLTCHRTQVGQWQLGLRGACLERQGGRGLDV